MKRFTKEKLVRLVLVITVIAAFALPIIAQQCDGCMQTVCTPSVSGTSGWGLSSASAVADAVANARSGCPPGSIPGATIQTDVESHAFGLWYTAHGYVQCNCS